MAKQFLPKMSREEREARILAEGIAEGTIIPIGSGPLPADRDIPMAEMLRAARLDGLARQFAIEAQSTPRAQLLTLGRYRDLRFHPRYKREMATAREN